MDQPFLGMIAAFGFSFPPRGWMSCYGQIISIQQNTALFSLLGTFYGGNGQTTFALPDLRGRTLIGQGQGPGGADYVIGESGGVENITLNVANLPAHNHVYNVVTTAGDSADPTNNRLAASPKTGSGPNATSLKNYSTATSNAIMNSGTIGSTGSNAAFTNMQPFLAVTYSVAMQGIFPSRN